MLTSHQEGSSLIPLLEQAKEGHGIDRTSLSAALNVYPALIDEISAELEQSIASQTFEQREYSANSARRARGAVDRLRELSWCLREEAAIADEPRLVSLASSLWNAMSQVAAAFTVFREHSMTALGPTGMSGINWICMVTDEVVCGQRHLEDLSFPLAHESARIRQFMEENADLPADVLGGAARVLVSLTSMALLQDEDADMLLHHKGMLLAAAERWEQMCAHQRFRGPSPLPCVNAVLFLAAEVVARRQSPHRLQEEVERVSADFRELASQIAELAGGTGSEAEGLRASILLARAAEGLKRVAEAAEAGQEDRCRSDVQVLVSTLHEFWSCQERLRQIAESPSSLLAAESVSEETDSLVMTEHLQALFDAVERFSAGEMSRELFRQASGRMYRRVQAARKKAPYPQPAPTDSRDLALPNYHLGMSDMSMGLEMLLRLEDVDHDIVHEACELIRDGACQLQTAQRGARAALAVAAA